ncbi:MAG: N-acetyl-gamma-glutamyl-phosphate reductase [Campylobacterota bacterium]|nr:N-acetyl-gamma-glutamyl-phosphate reductase [Campylobacterota bacterium]
MINVAIIGASGYTGLELVKILLNHPKFTINYIANSTGETKISDLHPSLKQVCELDVQAANAQEVAANAQLAFLALPHKTSMGFAKELLSLGVKVVDLSADYRLERDTYEKHYCAHEDAVNLPKSVYGLPEFYTKEIQNSSLIANPGCYPTATLLGLLPFIPYIDTDAPIFVDAKSGVSGAGKKLSEITSYVSVNENIFAYNPMKHRHAPEITEKVKLLQNKDISINFVPHLIAATRGMLVSIYATLKQDINPQEILLDAYKNENFIRVCDKPVDIKSTAGTNFCDLFAQKNDKALFVSSSIDNLLRGASSQAVVNANIMHGFDVHCGINSIAYTP